MTATTAIDRAGKNLAFIVGSPRSGTSWLARLMGATGEVAATQETELINRYCRPWFDAWSSQLPADPDQWSRHRHRGLPSVLTTEEFDEAVVGFARQVYAKALALKPTARVVVDKNPAYSLHVELVRQMFPDAAILHIVRDGRDVAASMLAASRGWGRDWAPADVTLAAQTWRTNVESAARAAQLGGRYIQVRYEDLLADGPRVLADCLSFVGVTATSEECAGVVARFDLTNGARAAGDSLVWSGEVVKRLGGVPAEPDGFAGTGSANGWRETWTAPDRLDFHHVAGQLLHTLGYAEDDTWLGVTAARRRSSAVRRRLLDACTRLGWRLHMLLGRRGVYVHIARIRPYAGADPGGTT
jgi:hypothetical protein